MTDDHTLVAENFATDLERLLNMKGADQLIAHCDTYTAWSELAEQLIDELDALAELEAIEEEEEVAA
jgi:hypothetical protein